MLLLEGKSKFIDKHIIVGNLIQVTYAFVVITSEEVSRAQHIGKIVGDFVSGG